MEAVMWKAALRINPSCSMDCNSGDLSDGTEKARKPPIKVVRRYIYASHVTANIRLSVRLLHCFQNPENRKNYI